MNPLKGDEQARVTADAVARRSYGKLVAFLAVRTHDLSAAEDALSEAFASASLVGRARLPRNPEGWLLTVARRKMIDVLRRHSRDQLGSQDLQALADVLAAAPSDSEIPDERLAMMFACAHPAIEAGIRAPMILAGGDGARCGKNSFRLSRLAGCHGQAPGPGQR